MFRNDALLPTRNLDHSTLVWVWIVRFSDDRRTAHSLLHAGSANMTSAVYDYAAVKKKIRPSRASKHRRER